MTLNLSNSPCVQSILVNDIENKCRINSETLFAINQKLRAMIHQTVCHSGIYLPLLHIVMRIYYIKLFEDVALYAAGASDYITSNVTGRILMESPCHVRMR